MYETSTTKANIFLASISHIALTEQYKAFLAERSKSIP